jgi:arsenate reductase
MTAFPIRIFHNPACGTSRNVVEMVRQAGHEPEVVEYLKTGWDRAELEALLKRAGLTPRQALREQGSPAEELGLLDPAASDERILDAMVEHPVLVNRPLVATPKGVRLARPKEAVFEIL